MKKGTGPFFTKFKNLNNMKSKITGIIRILIIAIILGLILGLAGGAFYLCIRGATGLRRAYPAFLLLLPWKSFPATARVAPPQNSSITCLRRSSGRRRGPGPRGQPVLLVLQASSSLRD